MKRLPAVLASVTLVLACGCSSDTKPADAGPGVPADGAPPAPDGAEPGPDGSRPAVDGPKTADGPVADATGADSALPPTWQQVASPVQGALKDVHGTTASDVWAVGAAVLHFEGQAWSVNDASPTMTVWAASPTDVWATTGGMGGLRRYDGSGWKSASASIASGYLWLGFWGTSPTDVWLAGLKPGLPSETAFAHFDGLAWDASLVVDGLAESLSGASATDVWAVGQISGGSEGGSWRYGGVIWDAVATGAGGSLHGVWVVASDDVWAVGQERILHFDGTKWSDATPQALGKGWLVDIWGNSPTAVWAVGYSERDKQDGVFGHGVIYRYDGASWAPVAVPGVVDATTPALFGIWGAGADDVWVVGDSGTILRLN